MFTMLTGKQNTLNYSFRISKLIKFLCLVMMVSIRNMIFAIRVHAVIDLQMNGRI